jgi:ribosomal protein L11 methyltransferase
LRRPWLSGETDRASTIVIEPAMAFGTGEHATTRSVIRLTQHAVDHSSLVADLGAGSGVLSIAAAKLGAPRVVAIQLDSDAVGNALENIRVNDVDRRVHFLEGDAFSLLPLIAPVNVVLANIVSSVLIRLLPVVHASLAPRGRAILSGILSEERQLMLDEIAKGDWRVDAEDEEDGW